MEWRLRDETSTVNYCINAQKESEIGQTLENKNLEVNDIPLTVQKLVISRHKQKSFEHNFVYYYKSRTNVDRCSICIMMFVVCT